MNISPPYIKETHSTLVSPDFYGWSYQFPRLLAILSELLSSWITLIINQEKMIIRYCNSGALSADFFYHYFFAPLLKRRFHLFSPKLYYVYNIFKGGFSSLLSEDFLMFILFMTDHQSFNTFFGPVCSWFGLFDFAGRVFRFSLFGFWFLFLSRIVGFVFLVLFFFWLVFGY